MTWSSETPFKENCVRCIPGRAELAPGSRYSVRILLLVSDFTRMSFAAPSTLWCDRLITPFLYQRWTARPRTHRVPQIASEVTKRGCSPAAPLTTRRESTNVRANTGRERIAASRRTRSAVLEISEVKKGARTSSAPPTRAVERALAVPSRQPRGATRSQSM